MDSELGKQIREQMGAGQPLNSEQSVKLVLQRVQKADCQLNGFVLEDFPRTQEEATLLARKSLIPHNVFYIDHPLENSFTRVANSEEFGHDRRVFAQRVKNHVETVRDVISFYQDHF